MYCTLFNCSFSFSLLRQQEPKKNMKEAANDVKTPNQPNTKLQSYINSVFSCRI